jgi:ABC-2 type transport system permease protein
MSMVFMIVPIYFVSHALQPMMAEKIGSEGGQYFAFVVVGIAVSSMLSVPISGPEAAISSGIRTGTLEVMLSTRTPLPKLLAGLLSYQFLWTAMRALVALGAAAVLGATFIPGRIVPAIGIVLLLVAAHLPFGILAAAMILAFRTSGPLAKIVTVGSGFLGGVYYPTTVIPSWIQSLSLLFPLTYGLRAIRQTLLEGAPVRAVLPDLAMLSMIGAGLMLVGALAFSRALRYAHRAGNLSQY